MNSVQQFWAEIREIQSKLPPTLFMISVTNRLVGTHGGVMTEVDAETAAKLIHAGTHERATEEQIDTYKESQRIKKGNAVRDGLRKLGFSVSTVDPKPTPGQPATRSTK